MYVCASSLTHLLLLQVLGLQEAGSLPAQKTRRLLQAL